PPGGVDYERVDALRGALLDAVEHHRRAVAALGSGDDGHPDPVRPDLELADRRGSEGVAGGEEDSIILLEQPMGELGDGGGLAGAVDADDQDHLRPGEGGD